MDVLATALETYMVSMAKFDMKSVAEIFNIAELLMAWPTGQVEILLWVQLAKVFPSTETYVVNLRLWKSQFGPEYLVDGAHPRVQGVELSAKFEARPQITITPKEVLGTRHGEGHVLFFAYGQAIEKQYLSTSANVWNMRMFVHFTHQEHLPTSQVSK